MRERKKEEWDDGMMMTGKQQVLHSSFLRFLHSSSSLVPFSWRYNCEKEKNQQTTMEERRTVRAFSLSLSLSHNLQLITSCSKLSGSTSLSLSLLPLSSFFILLLPLSSFFCWFPKERRKRKKKTSRQVERNYQTFYLLENGRERKRGKELEGRK